MNFRDQGIIISKTPLKENYSIVTVFTANHGIYSGTLRQYSKKNGDVLAVGNLVDFFWQARLHEHLGSAKAELIKPYNGLLISDKTKLYAFNSVVCILKSAFCEREPHNNLFPSLLEYLEQMKKSFSFSNYFRLELDILSETGYRLQLEKCAVTGKSDDLFYVSPKSGIAVSKNSGLAYADKLLILPDFNDLNSLTNIDFALKLTGYFLDRYIFNHNDQSSARQIFAKHITTVT